MIGGSGGRQHLYVVAQGRDGQEDDLLKVFIHPIPSISWEEFVGRLTLGSLPPWMSLMPIAIMYSSLAAIIVFGRVPPGHRDDWDIGEKLEVADR